MRRAYALAMGREDCTWGAAALGWMRSPRGSPAGFIAGCGEEAGIFFPRFAPWEHFVGSMSGFRWKVRTTLLWKAQLWFSEFSTLQATGAVCGWRPRRGWKMGSWLWCWSKT